MEESILEKEEFGLFYSKRKNNDFVVMFIFYINYIFLLVKIKMKLDY